MSMAMESNKSRMFKVITPIEKKDGGTFWMRIGTAFPNRDASINVYLDAMPTKQGVLQLREMTDEDFARRKGSGDGAPVPPPGNQDIPF